MTKVLTQETVPFSAIFPKPLTPLCFAAAALPIPVEDFSPS